MNSLGLYIDFPFCIARCAFCAFDVEGYRAAWAERYMTALRKEIKHYAVLPEITGRRITSVYLGGGTPSHYPSEILEDLLALCRSLFEVRDNAEITLEAHPATVDDHNLRAFRNMGINRLSIGIQSFSDVHLKKLGRHHTVQDAVTAFQNARSTGFTNIGIDLMYGLPEQSDSDWEKTLREAIALSPEHLSLYALTVETGTRFAKEEKTGHLVLPSEEETARFYETARTRLAAAGFEQYEISNFTKPGYQSRHNLRYWNQEEVLSFGISAHSYFNGERRVNVDNIPGYIEAIERGGFPLLHTEKIPAKERQIDRIIFGLRKTEGIRLTLLENNTILKKTTARLREEGLIEVKTGWMRLTSKGMLLADEVAMAYL